MYEISQARWLTVLLLAAVFFSPNAYRAAAHEEGAPFSGAIIEPLVNHHAHIENEQRLNSFSLNGMVDEDGNKRSGFVQSLELAYSNPTFNRGA